MSAQILYRGEALGPTFASDRAAFVHAWRLLLETDDLRPEEISVLTNRGNHTMLTADHVDRRKEITQCLSYQTNYTS